MKCVECGADIYEGVKKCPYCKTLTQAVKDDEKFRDFDFKYTITSSEQVDKIRKSAKSSGKKKSKGTGLKAKIEKYFADRRAAKRAARRAARRGEDPALAVKKLETKEEKNPFLRDTAVTDAGDDSLNAYTRVKKRRTTDSSSKRTGSGAGKKKSKKTGLMDKLKKFSSGSKASDNRKLLIRRIIGVAAILLIIVLVFKLMGALFCGGSESKADAATHSYVKDNALFMVYNGENMTLSKNVLDETFIRNNSEAETPQSVDAVIKSENIIKKSSDGSLVWFFENYDPETDSGRLCVVKNGKKITPISEAVHNSIVVSQDGKRILYLQATDKNGDMGVLYFWKDGIKEPLKLTSDIDHGTFEFSKNGKWAFFLQNMNRGEMSGDLYVRNVEKADDEKHKVDSDVCMLFGYDSNGKHHLYGKEYDTADGSFDVYAVNGEGYAIRLGERTVKSPLVQKKKNTVLILGQDDDGEKTTHNLYLVEVSSGKKTKIDSSVNSVLMLSKKEDIVIYEKMYNGKIADFYAYTEGKMAVKVAANVIVDYDVVGTNHQVSATADGKKFAYISEFETLKGGGTLTLLTYENGKETSKEQIAEDVRSCHRTSNNRFVFTKNYSPSKKFFDVYVLEGGEERLLKEEVYPEAFGVDQTGNNIYYISNYNVEGKFGTLVRMNLKGEETEITDNVYGFSISSNGDVLIKKNLNSGENTYDLYLLPEGNNECVEINTSIGEIL